MNTNARLFLEVLTAYEKERDSLISDQKIQLAMIADLQQYQREYNELRKVIDNGSESATHASALYRVVEREDEIESLTAERDSLKEGLEGWHARYLDAEVERDALQEQLNTVRVARGAALAGEKK